MTTSYDGSGLDRLEAHSIYVFREARHRFSSLAMLWSMGKDSNVMLWLALKAFCGRLPFPVVHLDTTYEFPQMLAFRDQMITRFGLELVVARNDEALARGVGYATHDPVTVTDELKTTALKQAVAKHKWQGLVTGIRRDEDATRAKERVFSPRTAAFEWRYKDQPPEFWDQFCCDLEPGEHMRVQPLLDWSELDIWLYIQREGIPIPAMYFARPNPATGRMERYRSVGCMPITHPVASEASTIDDILRELMQTRVSERAGRSQDHHERNAMQKLRAKGFL